MRHTQISILRVPGIEFADDSEKGKVFMGQADVITIIKDAIYTILICSAPMLGIGLLIGVLVSIFQATTQINEQTLAFVPKIIGIFLSLLIFGGWILNNLTDLFTRIYGYINTMV